jgi:hypothetical protein
VQRMHACRDNAKRRCASEYRSTHSKVCSGMCSCNSASLHGAQVILHSKPDTVPVLHGLPVGVFIEEIGMRVADVEFIIPLLSLNPRPVISSFLMHAYGAKYTCYWDNDVAARHVPLSATMRCQACLRRSICSPLRLC